MSCQFNLTFYIFLLNVMATKATSLTMSNFIHMYKHFSSEHIVLLIDTVSWGPNKYIKHVKYIVKNRINIILYSFHKRSGQQSNITKKNDGGNVSAENFCTDLMIIMNLSGTAENFCTELIIIMNLQGTAENFCTDIIIMNLQGTAKKILYCLL